MLQKLYSANDIAERYGCSPLTARRYIRQMQHMENPLRATESAVAEWERSRTIPSEAEIMERMKKIRRRA